MLAVVIATFLGCWLIGSRVSVSANVMKLADRYVIAIALPVLIFATMTQVDLNADIAIPVAIAWVAMATCAGAVVLLGAVMHWEKNTIGALLLVAVLGNTSFLGIGVVRSLLGADHVAAAISYDQIGTFLALATYGSWIAGRYGTGDHGVSQVARRLVRFPPFLALVASVGARTIVIPHGVLDAMSAVGKTVAPVAMGVLGLRFRLTISRRALRPALWGLLLKMLCVPAVIAVVAVVAGVNGEVAWAASVMQSAAPPMVTAGVVAVNAGFDEEVVTFMVGVGTLSSFVLFPVIGMLF